MKAGHVQMCGTAELALEGKLVALNILLRGERLELNGVSSTQ